MINLSVDDIIKKIKEKAQATEAEILKKIDDKLNDLPGLISKQGAAHIIANDYGVNLYEQLSGRVKIKDISGGMRSLETAGKVQRIFEVKEFNTGSREGKVGSIIIGDETGTIRVVFWNNQTDNINNLKEDNIVLIRNAYARDNQGNKEIHINDKALININPENVTVGEVKETSTFTPNLTRKKITELSPNDSNVELLGTIVQVFDLRFFEVCPKCSKRIRMHQDSFVCEQHEKVDPSYSYVLSIVLDDGSMPNGNIRTVFFRDQALSLINKNPEQILKFKDSSTEFDTTKTELLGEMIKVSGRVKTNEMFDRLEFLAQAICRADPDQELKRLESTMSSEDPIKKTTTGQNQISNQNQDLNSNDEPVPSPGKSTSISHSGSTEPISKSDSSISENPISESESVQ